jgi:hypothetical protein
MQTPLEFIDDNCFVLVELRSAPSLSAIRCQPATPAAASEGGPGCTGSAGCAGNNSPFKRLSLSRNKTKAPSSSSSSQSNHADSTHNCIAWYIIPIKLSSINSESETVEMNRYPVQYPPLPGQPDGTNSYSHGKEGAKEGASDGSFLEVSVVISRSDQNRRGGCSSTGKESECSEDGYVSLEEYKMQPQWVHQHRPLPMDNVQSGSVTITGLPKTPVSESVAVVNISKLIGIQTVQKYRETRLKEHVKMQHEKDRGTQAKRRLITQNSTSAMEGTSGSPSTKLFSSLEKLKRSVSIAATLRGENSRETVNSSGDLEAHLSIK